MRQVTAGLGPTGWSSVHRHRARGWHRGPENFRHNTQQALWAGGQHGVPRSGCGWHREPGNSGREHPNQDSMASAAVRGGRKHVVPAREHRTTPAPWSWEPDRRMWTEWRQLRFQEQGPGSPGATRLEQDTPEADADSPHLRGDRGTSLSPPDMYYSPSPTSLKIPLRTSHCLWRKFSKGKVLILVHILSLTS